MYKQFKVRITVSIVLAILAAYLTYMFFYNLQQEENIVIAKKTIEPHTKITKDMLATMSISKKDKQVICPKAVNKVEDLEGSIAVMRLEANRPIEKRPDAVVFGNEKAAALNADGNVDNAYFIPADKRIIAVSVDAPGALDYKLKKNDYIDVIYTSKEENTGGCYSNMIVQHIQIFDIENINQANDITSAGQKSQNVLLLATPEECLKINAAKRNGMLDLVLNPLKGEIKNVQPVNVLQFSAYKPMPKSEELKALESQIKQGDLSEPIKKTILANIDKEKQIESIKQSIEASVMSKEKKDKLLELLK